MLTCYKKTDYFCAKKVEREKIYQNEIKFARKLHFYP
jgi:hypothetical protein